MRDYKVYVCERCEQEFVDDFEGCLKHEEHGHIGTGFAIPKASYLAPTSYYPDTLEITMLDGSVVSYDIKNVIQGPIDKEKESPLGKED